jgi:hypothetical protein
MCAVQTQYKLEKFSAYWMAESLRADVDLFMSYAKTIHGRVYQKSGPMFERSYIRYHLG